MREFFGSRSLFLVPATREEDTAHFSRESGGVFEESPGKQLIQMPLQKESHVHRHHFCTLEVPFVMGMETPSAQRGKKSKVTQKVGDSSVVSPVYLTFLVATPVNWPFDLPCPSLSISLSLPPSLSSSSLSVPLPPLSLPLHPLSLGMVLVLGTELSILAYQMSPAPLCLCSGCWQPPCLHRSGRGLPTSTG